jgi:hypothetical protein
VRCPALVEIRYSGQRLPRPRISRASE